MATNDQIVLARVLEQKREEVAPELTASEYFGFFGTEQVLKDSDLSWDEIENGITDGGDDGGIDGLYVFVDGVLVPEDAEVQGGKSPIIELEILQHKKERSFAETPLDRLGSTLDDFLNLDKEVGAFSESYNDAVLGAIGNFRRIFLELASKFPTLKIGIRYVSQGADIHPKVQRKADKIVELCQQYFPDAEVEIEFVGAARLLELAQTSPEATYALKVSETVSTANVGFACLVNISELNELISTEDGSLRTQIFEANVRDYQGRVEVNSAIQDTLNNPQNEDFWWLNNGVTIIAEKASLAGKTLTIDSPQIVNGLQTSTEIYKFFVDQDDDEVIEDNRHVLVRVLIPDTEESRDRIIRATNSQTSIPQASLRATDPLQQQIETYFRTHDLYYDRRKNYYKNQGKPREKIVGIPYLAQAVMSVVLGEPDNARARPSSLLKRDEDYARVFGADYPIDVFLSSASLMRQVDEYLIRQTDYRANERNNRKFHMGFVLSRLVSGESNPSLDDIASLDLQSVTDEDFALALSIVDDELRGVQSAEKMASMDRAAKSKHSVVRLEERLVAELKKGGKKKVSRAKADRGAAKKRVVKRKVSKKAAKKVKKNE